MFYCECVPYAIYFILLWPVCAESVVQHQSTNQPTIQQQKKEFVSKFFKCHPSENENLSTSFVIQEL